MARKHVFALSQTSQTHGNFSKLETLHNTLHIKYLKWDYNRFFCISILLPKINLQSPFFLIITNHCNYPTISFYWNFYLLRNQGLYMGYRNHYNGIIFKLIFMEVNSHKTCHFKVNNSEGFRKSIMLCNLSRPSSKTSSPSQKETLPH